MRLRLELALSQPQAGVSWIPASLYAEGVELEQAEWLPSGHAEVTVDRADPAKFVVGRELRPVAALLAPGALLGPLPAATVTQVTPLSPGAEEEERVANVVAALTLFAVTAYFVRRIK